MTLFLLLTTIILTLVLIYLLNKTNQLTDKVNTLEQVMESLIQKNNIVTENEIKQFIELFDQFNTVNTE